ncbi:hypothetical protein LIMNO130_20022 [Limnobacter sp. 130]|nr:hypothetical protein LIMNO130_20022 [Limnobacter sp. 130]
MMKIIHLVYSKMTAIRHYIFWI